MSHVNYDEIAPEYDQRYERNRFDGILAALTAFLGTSDLAILEVGCGTGYWLSTLRPGGKSLAWTAPPQCCRRRVSGRAMHS